MDIKNDLKQGVRLAADAATDIAQTLIEKNRMRANANRIKQVIKGDTELRNQAYIELGRYFYENLREDADSEQEALCVVVDKTTARITKASKKYVELISDAKDLKIPSENSDKIKQAVSDKAKKAKDATEAKVNDIKGKATKTAQQAKDKAVDLGTKAKEKATDLTDKAKNTAMDLTAKTKETVFDIGDKAKDKFDDFKAFIAPDEDLDDIIDGNNELEDMIAQQEEIIKKAESQTDIDFDSDDEESPEDFTF